MRLMSGQQRAGQRAEAVPDHGGREAEQPPHSPRPSCGSGFRGFLWIQSLPTFLPEAVGSLPFPKLVTDTLVSQRSVSSGGSSYPKHASTVHRGRWSCCRCCTRGAGPCAHQVSTPGGRGCYWLLRTVKSAGLGNFEEMS